MSRRTPSTAFPNNRSVRFCSGVNSAMQGQRDGRHSVRIYRIAVSEPAVEAVLEPIVCRAGAAVASAVWPDQ